MQRATCPIYGPTIGTPRGRELGRASRARLCIDSLGTCLMQVRRGDPELGRASRAHPDAADLVRAGHGRLGRRLGSRPGRDVPRRRLGVRQGRVLIYEMAGLLSKELPRRAARGTARSPSPSSLPCFPTPPPPSPTGLKCSAAPLSRAGRLPREAARPVPRGRRSRVCREARRDRQGVPAGRH